MRIAGLLVACAVGMGCTVGTTDVTDGELDEMSLDRVPGYRTMSRINAHAYKSTLGAFDVNCYVAGDIVDYRKIHPERSGSNATVAHGTMIVREVLDTSGQVAKLTVMAKGPPGYDPSLGDWWFAVTDPRGTPLVENGVVQLGRLSQCHNCHLDRSHDDFLFGVSSSYF
ncbi:MAG TPA: hypothetical protein VN253_16875 [Kofleriaceae bacterium]|nr:hypothetical protein [Kofleriaceae bacterium]